MSDMKTMKNSLPVIATVKCTQCGKLHNVDDETFMTFYGNVMIGTDSGVIGNNFDDKGRLVKSTIICRSEECMSFLVAVCHGSDGLKKADPGNSPPASPPKSKKKS